MMRSFARWGLAIGLGLLVTQAVQADPDWYAKRATWQETMYGAQQALAKPPVGVFRTYVSPLLRGGQAAVKVDVPVAGVDDLYLIVLGIPDVVGGAATWADARLVEPGGKTLVASRVPGLQVLQGRHAVDVNLKSGVSGPLRIAGQKFDRGLHVYANSVVRIPLRGRFARFESWIGIDDWVGRRGSVRFLVTDAAGAARQEAWDLLYRDFSQAEPRQQMQWEREDQIWDSAGTALDDRELARRYAQAASYAPHLAEQTQAAAASVGDGPEGDRCNRVRECYYTARAFAHARDRLPTLGFAALRRALLDLQGSFGQRYPGGAEYLRRLDALEVETRQGPSPERILALVADFDRLQQEALLANPLLDFERLLLIRRRPHGDPRLQEGTGYGVGEYIGLPRQSSKCNPGIDEPCNWENDIAVLQPVRPDGQLTSLYQPEGRRLVTDVDLHWDAQRLLFSMPGRGNLWQVYEIGADGQGLRQLSPGDQPDVHAYDACYLPDDQIAFISTAPLQGVPCNAGVIVGMMYLMAADGSRVRQVCFEQDHDYCPTVLNSGRLLYLRWDYTDTPHVWNRILFSMNPDGTDQMEYYGANSYWPNAIFYARPVPNHPTKIVGIVTGHHVGRVGELVVFDPALGRRETDGVVQRIPGYGQKVEPVIEDKLTEHSWPKFLHPYPLSDKYFLVSCKPTPTSLWGLYLADVFDNLVLIKEQEQQALLEPIPLRPQPRPPILASSVRPERTDATVFLADVYQGPGLQGIPRGTVKSLRVFSYHFGYQRIAGIDHRVGTDGPWEMKRILGTVAVEPDGSALFRVPAKTPLSVQPLDAEGRALQLMRSWMVAQPGETLSCIGCHDHRSVAPTSRHSLALQHAPQVIRPWYGPARNFSFAREVQPVLDRHCVRCHDGATPDGEHAEPNLRGNQQEYLCWRGGDPQLKLVRGVAQEQLAGRYGGIFSPSYIALRRLVRAPGLESDLRLLPATEFHASNSELIQRLRVGHHGIQLDAESWDRLYTWIDLNAPEHGSWSEFARISGDQRQRRCALRQLYGGVEEDGEELPAIPPAYSSLEGVDRPVSETADATRPVSSAPISSTPVSSAPAFSTLAMPPPTLAGWPWDAAEAARRQASAGPTTRTLDLGAGVRLELIRIPAGQFVMGSQDGNEDERPAAAVEIVRPFWIGRCEVTNSQFARCLPTHQSRYEHRGSWIFAEEYLGWPLDELQQPVVRVSWDDAQLFCRWVAAQTKVACRLPTEAEWEYACRAGTATDFSFGPRDADFAWFANVADATLRDLAYQSWSPRTPDIVPRDDRFSDGGLVSLPVGSYRPNAWGLCDLHGNVAEWTQTAYRPYPYRDDDGRNAPDATGTRVVRGGSWRDRPVRCRSAARLSYASYQRIYNVGFRIVCTESP